MKGIDDKPAFNWWVHAVLQKCEHIITLVKKWSAWFLKKTHKFGIEVPRSVKDVNVLEKKNDNTLWANAITKEINNVCTAFNNLANGDKAPVSCWLSTYAFPHDL